MPKRQMKCKWCKESGIREDMVCYSQDTGQFNKSGTKKIRRSYAHVACDEIEKEQEEFKKQEVEELDKLYKHLLNLHGLETIDGRMFMKIQDLRNGSVGSGRQKISRFKEGVPYTQMLDTYLHMAKRIDSILKGMSFKTKWNEFSYIFGVVINNLNEVKSMQKLNAATIIPTKVESADHNLKVRKRKSNREDEMDISDFL